MSVNELIRLLSTLPEHLSGAPVLLEVQPNVRHNLTTVMNAENCVILADLSPVTKFEDALKKAGVE